MRHLERQPTTSTVLHAQVKPQGQGQRKLTTMKHINNNKDDNMPPQRWQELRARDVYGKTFFFLIYCKSNIYVWLNRLLRSNCHDDAFTLAQHWHQPHRRVATSPLARCHVTASTNHLDASPFHHVLGLDPNVSFRSPRPSSKPQRDWNLWVINFQAVSRWVFLFPFKFHLIIYYFY